MPTRPRQTMQQGATDHVIATLEAVRRQSPRVQCLTNSVAQPITANTLLALGARVSMATHPAEVVAMSAGADAVLINLGTLDGARETAIPILRADAAIRAKPTVLDPVFVEHSPVRMALACAVLSIGEVVIKGNGPEITALRGAADVASHHTFVTTGPIDRVERGDRRAAITLGHPMMAAVTGLGCAAGAVIAACHTVEADPVRAAVAGLMICGIAGEVAAEHARGTGSFATAFIDAVSLIDADMILRGVARARRLHDHDD